MRIFLMLFIRTLYTFMPTSDDLTKHMKSSSKLNRLVLVYKLRRFSVTIVSQDGLTSALS